MEFAQRIASIEREIRALKTAHNTAPIVESYHFTFKPDDYQGATTYRVHYGTGDQPIISDAYRQYGDCAFGGATGNTQILNTFSQAEGSITITATRPITSIEAI